MAMYQVAIRGDDMGDVVINYGDGWNEILKESCPHHTVPAEVVYSLLDELEKNNRVGYSERRIEVGDKALTLIAYGIYYYDYEAPSCGIVFVSE